MARIDTLGHFLSDVAAAIRTAEGSSETITASTFDTRIEALSGGGGASYAPSYISFAYYDDVDLSYEVSNVDTSNITNMSAMFSMCSVLESLDLSNFDTSNVVYMSNMFANCSNLLSIDFTGFDTSSVEDMAYMFNNCSSLTSLDLSGFDTTSLADSSGMFDGCSSLAFIDMRGFDFSNIQNYSDMFSSVDTNCEIVVADDGVAKDWMTDNFPDMENVKTVSEYEEEHGLI